MAVYIALKLVVFLTLFRSMNLESQRKEFRCSNFCLCEEILPGKLFAQCNVTGYQNRSASDLFGQEFLQINHLDLSRTNLQQLDTGILHNLTHLEKPYLEFNDMRSWHGNVRRDLPNLVYLNVTGNKHWLPGKDLLSLTKLRMIEGVWWREECGVCLLTKIKIFSQESSSNNTCYNNATEHSHNESCKNDSKETSCMKNECKDEEEENSTPELEDIEDNRDETEEFQFPYPNDIVYGRLYEFYKLNFIAKCQHDLSCRYYELYSLYDSARFKMLVGIRYILFSLGTASILINLVVILTVMTRIKLRASSSFVLIALLAASDFLTGLYSILQANFASFITFHQQEILTHSEIHSNEVKCYISGYVFTTAQVTSPMTSLLLTVERYLVIVYGLNPNKRLNRKNALRCSLLAWVVAMVIAFVPFFAESIKYNGISHCSLPNVYETKASFWVRNGLYIATCCLVAPYVVGILLYLRIYTVVKRTGKEIGNRTDLKVAKKISQIVFSNLVFFVIPTVLLYIHSNFYNKLPDSFTDTLTAHRIYLFVFTSLPLLCFNINACLNPFLFALRNDTFKQQMKRMVAEIFARCRKIGERSEIPTNQQTNTRLNNDDALTNTSFNKDMGHTNNTKTYFNEGIQLEEKRTTSNDI